MAYNPNGNDTIGNSNGKTYYGDSQSPEEEARSRGMDKESQASWVLARDKARKAAAAAAAAAEERAKREKERKARLKVVNAMMNERRKNVGRPIFSSLLPSDNSLLG